MINRCKFFTHTFSLARFYYFGPLSDILLEQVRDTLKEEGFKTKLKTFTEKEIEKYYEAHPHRDHDARTNVHSITLGRSNWTSEQYNNWFGEYVMLNWESYIHDIQNPDRAAKMAERMSEENKADFAEYIEEARKGWHNKPTLPEFKWMWDSVFKKGDYDPD